MKVYEAPRHTTWDCKYHVVFIPKCRRKALFGQVRQELGGIFRALAGERESEIIEGHLMPDHVHMLISVRRSIRWRGYIKGKRAIHITRVYAGRRRNFVGQNFWARGYWVSTVGKDHHSKRHNRLFQGRLMNHEAVMLIL